MSDWTDGNVPKDKELFYWITIQEENNKKITHPFPCLYSADTENWKDFCGNTINKDVIAYSVIKQPLSYTKIGFGVGYYIKTVYDGDEQIYGHGLQPVNWSGQGYGTLEKAKTALRRLRKLDIQEGYTRELYEVINCDGETVFSLP